MERLENFLNLNEGYREDIKKVLDKSDENFKEYFSELEDHFYKHFPNGFFNIFWNQIVGDPHIAIRIRLIKDEKDIVHKIKENDPMFIYFSGWVKGSIVTTDKPVNKDVNIELNTNYPKIYIKPEPGSNYALGSVKVNFRKRTSTMDKHMKPLKEFITNLSKAVIENKDNFQDWVDKKKYLDTVK